MNTVLYLFCFFCALVSAAEPAALQPKELVSDGEHILMNDAGQHRLLRYSTEGQLLASSESFSQKIERLYLTDKHILLLSGGFGGKITRLDRESLKPLQSQVIGHSPSALYEDKARGLYWVSLRHEGALVALNAQSLECVARLAVGREPLAMAAYEGGNRLLLAGNLPEQSADSYPIASMLRFINLEQKRVEKSLMLPNGSTDVKSLVIDRAGQYAYVVHLLARYQLPTNQVDRGWMNTNAMSIISLKEQKILATVLLDSPQRGAANPWHIIMSDDEKHILIALAGSHELLRIDCAALHDRLQQYAQGKAPSPSSLSMKDIVNDASFLHGIRDFVSSGGNGTRHLLLHQGRLYLSNYFSGNVTCLSAEGEAQPWLQGEKSLADSAVGRGEMNFHDATLCFQQWQSCASCHPNDARMDGLNWDLLNDGMGNPKNTKSLLYSHSTAPAMARGIRPNAEYAVRSGFAHIFFAQVDESICRDVDSYLKSLRAEKSPYLTPQGGKSEEAQRGELHFNAHCSSCHPAPQYTDKKQYPVHWTRGSEKGKKMDVPQLQELWRTAPYLYDGRAVDLQELIRVIHKTSAPLRDKEVKELEAYLHTL